MLFPTITFAVFFLLVFIGNWLLMPRPRLWKPFILVASAVFYGWWEWRFVLLLAVSAVANQLFAVAIQGARTRSGRKWLLAAAVVANLGVLGWFKYYGFFVTSVVNFLGAFGLNADLPLLRIVLPVGISFLTFRVLSYVIDVYRGTLRTASLLDFAVYVAFFPYTLAGPIARASEFLPQLKAPRDPRRVDTSRAFFLIFAGLAKKMLLADYLATHIVNGVFTTPGEYSSLEVLVGIIGYSVQIYCDFSAYADIAIGISLLLGFELPDNFDAPYTAVSVQDFWRRWHMTLSRWLRDYLYIPLGGNRKGRARTYINLMLTMLLGGLWHGAGWTFIFWGALYGGALVVEHRRLDVRKARAARRSRADRAAPVPAVAGGAPQGGAVASGSTADGGGISDLDRSARALAAMSGGPAYAAPAAGPQSAAGVPAGASPGLSQSLPPTYDKRPWGGGWLPRIGVFAFVTFAWVFFRSPSFGAALDVLAQLFRGWGGVGAAVTPAVLLAIAVGIGVQYVPRTFYQRLQSGFSVLNPALQGLALAIGFMLLDVLGPTGPATFLYFQF
jgi:D-alanyl-lipoteichoic acid acyltransferase DltB (MBOAT superfamily)